LGSAVLLHRMTDYEQQACQAPAPLVA